MTYIKILFLCSRNKRRSLTAEKVLDGRNGHIVRSAGTENNSRNKVSAGLIGWADIIVTMEKKHSEVIRRKYKDEVYSKRIVCLRIPDDYEYMSEELIEILEDAFDELINE